MQAVHSSKTQGNILWILPRISENLLLIAWILSSSPNFHLQRWSSKFLLVYNHPSDFAIFGSSGWSLPALACLVPVTIVLDLFRGYKTSPFHPEFQFKEHVEITRVSRQGGEQWSYYYLSGIPSQQVRCVQEHCPGATTSLHYLKSQAICTSHFPSVVSKSHRKTSHWQSYRMERTPFAQFLKLKKKMVSIDLKLLWTWRAFFSCGEDGVFHCEDCCLVSGS